MKIPITLKVNGSPYSLEVDPRARLLDTVRYQLDLTGAKEGCGTGDCGACTMLVDGKPVTTCLVFSATCNNRDVTTVEGVSKPGVLSAVQQAFVKHTALQCGVCIPGFIVNATALLQENPNPTEAEVRFHLQGNLCRCTGYTKIIEAVLDAAQQLSGTAVEPRPEATRVPAAAAAD
jgi:aerobic carbon-monoxide dehydrogenase small subunit